MTTEPGIFLGRIRIGDNTDILKIFTHHSGLISFVSKGARAKNNRISSLFRPLSRLHCSFRLRDNRELQFLQSAEALAPSEDALLGEHPVRGAVATFLAEVLVRAVEDGYRNEGLFDFLNEQISLLATEENFVNRHLICLLGLARVLGIEPESQGIGSGFHLSEGHPCPEDVQNPYVLRGPDAERFRACLTGRMPEDRQSRSALTDHLILYFRLHLEHMRPLKSPEVLREVLG
jgi:DNA repair protein RecO (recombination protein O)